MKRLLVVLTLTMAVPAANARRSSADPAACDAALAFLKAAGAVAIVGTDAFYDGGSLEYTFESEKGIRHAFVLSVETQRQSLQRSLSLYDGNWIHLVPDAVYDQMARLLREKLKTGVSTGLQTKWPEFTPEAKALVRLLNVPGYRGDLEPLFEIRVKRLRMEHEKWLREHPAKSETTPPDHPSQSTPGQRLPTAPSPPLGAPPR